MSIRVLPDDIIRLIRAGEVVQRPASLLKELIENSVDAGAKNIKIDIAKAGRELIRVIDDGFGMDLADLEICTERHATSKLKDLNKIDTFGFRGEALAAAASVADMTIISRQSDAPHAWKMSIVDGQKREAEPYSGNRGTIVEAKDLFARLPPRAAFLASDRRENKVIRDVVDLAALSHPNIAFWLNLDGKQIVFYGPKDIDQRIRDVLGNEFYVNSLPIGIKQGSIEVAGRVALPTWPGNGKGQQKILVNDRPVSDGVISSGIRAAFSLVSKEQNPAAIIKLRLPPENTDVNVHPSKAEIRFKSPTEIHQAVQSAIADALAGRKEPGSPGLTSAAIKAASTIDMVNSGDHKRLPLGKAMGVALGTFILSEASDGIVITDMHAAHERIIHEKIKLEYKTNQCAAKTLGEPILIKVSDFEAENLSTHQEDLEKFGLIFNVLDNKTVAILGLPDFVPPASAKDLLASISRALRDDDWASPIESKFEEICASISCHAAIKDGDEIDADKAGSLLRHLENSPNNSTCMHGRPLSVILPRDKILQLFGRR